MPDSGGAASGAAVNNLKVYSLHENEESDYVHSHSSDVARIALRKLLRDTGDEEEIAAGALAAEKREVELLRCLATGCAPPLWDKFDAPVFHAHGTLKQPVFTKLAYRELLHDGPNYMP